MSTVTHQEIFDFIQNLVSSELFDSMPNNTERDQLEDKLEDINAVLDREVDMSDETNGVRIVSDKILVIANNEVSEVCISLYFELKELAVKFGYTVA